MRKLFTMLRAAGLVAVVSLVSLMVPGVAAGKDHAATERNTYGPFDVGQPVVACEGFDVLASYQLLVKETVFRNVSGEIAKILVVFDVVEGRARYYNSARPQNSVFGLPAEHEKHLIVFVNGEPVTEQVSGPGFMITVPGYGVIFAETGMVRWDLVTGQMMSNTGWNQFIEQDGAALCSSLQ